jgi:hypothetical protein
VTRKVVKVSDDIAPSESPPRRKGGGETFDQPTRRLGRRTLVLGAATAGVGAAASLVTGAQPAAAANGSPVLLGETNKASEPTTMINKSGVALECLTESSNQMGVFAADSSNDGGFGLYGQSINGTGIYGAITGDTQGQSAIQGVDSTTGDGGGTGVSGVSNLGYGVTGSTSSAGFYGVFGSALGVGGVGVTGFATGEYGIGVYGYGAGNYGVYARSENADAVFAYGNAQVTGSLSKGGGSFKIDHPVDPQNKYLYHSFVESPDMMNVYNGMFILDGDGRATVELPDWFEALNRDFRYQLTALLGAAPELHVSALVADGEFSIAGGKAGQQVSWQVTGIRQDAWANANRIPVEVDKPEEDRGRYLHHELFGGEAITALAKARDLGRHRHSNIPTV